MPGLGEVGVISLSFLAPLITGESLPEVFFNWLFDVRTEQEVIAPSCCFLFCF